ncbi:hypothetical protein VNI00_002518 [Paramarasmius palmivorus]|uniref:BTB domain-containing protein n=1 Tax=Paramarasmius palmivorus TaxID=297713 RepID=A0AAW0DVT6_9AGAR
MPAVNSLRSRLFSPRTRSANKHRFSPYPVSEGTPYYPVSEANDDIVIRAGSPFDNHRFSPHPVSEANHDIATRPATSPFDNPRADLRLRSFDGVEFKVFSSILTAISPLFDDVLHADHSTPSDQLIVSGISVEARVEHGPTVIRVVERSEDLEKVLRLFQPGVPIPLFPQLDDMISAIDIMIKYQMTKTAEYKAFVDAFLDRPLKEKVAERVWHNTIRVFWALRDRAPSVGDALEKAPKRVLGIPLEYLVTAFVPEMATRTAKDLIELQRYHFQTSQTLQSHTPSFLSWPNDAPQLLYSCGKTSLTVSLTLRGLHMLYRSALEHCDDHPFQAAVFSCICSLLPSEESWRCLSCKRLDCSSMVAKYQEILQKEMEYAISSATLQL